MAGYRDPERDVDERVDDLLKRMTRREKVCQLGGAWSSALVKDDAFDPELARSLLADGIGQITRIGASTGLEPGASAAFSNRIQRWLVEETRLGIPAIVHEEALAGYCARGATQFPQAIGLAATYDPARVQQVAEVAREQMRAVGARLALAPVLDIARDPRWGRLEETYGEDAYLAGRMGVAYVRGLQGDDLGRGVLATGKHFLGYGLSEGGMNHAPVHLGPRELREVFAEPFAAAIREAGLACVMNSYSSVDGVACAGAPEILRGLLRDELGFRGIVVADYFSVNLLVRHHRVARDKAEAAGLALAAGLDVELPALDCYGEPLEGLLDAGRLDPALLDEAVARVLKLKFQLGLFDAPYVDETSASSVFDTPAQRALARTLAEESIVLLENDGVLPLEPGCRIALLGPTADDARLLLGDYHYPAHSEIVYRREQLPTAIAPASRGAFQPGPHFVPMATPRAALEARGEVIHVRGCGLGDAEPAELDSAVAAARDADVAVVCVGGRSGLMPDCTSGEFRDASDLELTGRQVELIEAVAATNRPTVVVVIGGRAFALERAKAAANALVLAWLPGEEGGHALARVLYGEANPAGRLPVSLPRRVGQVPVYYNHRAGGGHSMPLGDYTDGSTRPLYPFGHGLSYSRFEYSSLRCPDAVDTHGAVTVSVEVANVSEVPGEEVVQLYVTDKVADVARPVRQLAGFQRISLPPGGTCTISFRLDATQLAYYDRALHYVVDPGEVEIQVGASSDDIRERAVLNVQGERRPLKQQQRLATQIQVTEGS